MAKHSATRPTAPEALSPVSPAQRLTLFRQQNLARPLWLVQCASLLMSLIYLAGLIPLKRDLTFPEAALVARALESAAGLFPYHDWHAWPHGFSPYGPLTYYVPGLLVKLWPGPPELWAGFEAGRIVSLASIFGLLAVVAYGIRNLTGSWAWAVPPLTLALRWQSMWQFCASYRPDAPRTLLAVAAVALLVNQTPSKRRIWIVFGLLWLSFWFKPTGFGVLFGLLWWLSTVWGWRRALRMGALFGGSGLLLFFGLDFWSGGLLRLNMIDSLRNGFELARMHNYLENWSRPVDLMIPLAMVLALIYAWRSLKQKSMMGFRPLLFTLPLSVIFTIAQMLKIGADENYFIEPLALSALLLGSSLANWWEGEQSVWGRRVREFAWLGLVLPWLLYDAAVQARFLPLQMKTLVMQYKPLPVTRYAEQLEGPILSFQSWLCMSPRNHETVLDWFQYKNLVTRGYLDPEPLRMRLRRQEFSAVILRDENHDHEKIMWLWGDAFGEGFYRELTEYYVEQDSIGVFNPFVPRR